MNPSSNPSAAPFAARRPRLQLSFERRHTLLRVARYIWLALAALSLGLFLVAVPYQIDRLSKGFVGLRWSRNAGRQVVLMPTPGLPAFDAGVRPGDILLTANGVTIGPETPPGEISRLLQTTRDVTVDVRTGDGTLRHFALARDTRSLDALGFTGMSYALYLTTLDLIVVLISSVVAFLIFWHSWDDWFALIISLTLILLAVRLPTELYILAYNGVLGERLVEGVVFCAVLATNATLALFPNGRLVPGWTRWFLVLSLGYAFLVVYPASPMNRVIDSNGDYIVIDVLVVGLGIVAQVIRYTRSSNLHERQQTKWVVWGLTLTFVVYYVYALVPVFLPDLASGSTEAMAYEVYFKPLAYVALLATPATIAISILRYRLWDIDVVIRRTLVYALLTAIIAGLFAALITLSQVLLPAGGLERDMLAVVTTLVVVAAFTPARNKLQDWIDNRYKGGGLGMQRLKQFCAQVQLRVAPVQEQQITRRLLEEAIAAFGAQGGVVYLVHNGEAQRIHAVGNWDDSPALTMPLLYGDQEIGELALGVRTSGRAYSLEEQEVLDQATLIVARAITEDHLLVRY